MSAIHVKVRDARFEEVVFTKGKGKSAYRRGIKRRTRTALDRVERYDY